MRSAHPSRLRCGITFWLAVSALVPVQFAAIKLPFDAWQRASQQPIFSPQGDSWESAGTFNPSVVRQDGKYIMLYRAQDKHGTSRLGYAESTDGIHFARRPEPVLVAARRLREGWRRRGPPAGPSWRNVLSHLHPLQQKRRTAVSDQFQDLIHW